MQTLEALIQWLDDHSDHYRSKINDYESPVMSAVLAHASGEEATSYLPEPRSSTYYKYRSLLKKRLLQEVLAIEPAKLDNQERAQIRLQCQQWIHALEVIATNGGESIAVDLLKKIWHTSEIYAFSDLKWVAVRWYWRLYAIVPDRVDSLSLPPEEGANLHQVIHYEDMAEQAYFRLSWEQSPSPVDVSLNPSVVEDVATRLAELPAEVSSFQLHVFRELTQSRLDAHERNYHSLLARNQALLLYLKNQDFQDTWSLQRVYLNVLEGYAHTINQSAFTDCLQEGLTCVSIGSIIWVKYYDLGIRLSLATGNFAQCTRYFQEVINSKCLSGKPPEIKEQWRVYAAYLKFIGKVQPEYAPDKGTNSTFRLGKFMNETPVFSKDKQGMNIPILIAQFLVLLSQKKYHKLIDRSEALAKYQSRYLQHDERFRSQCFLKMLLQLPANNFHRQAVERKTADWFSRLHKPRLNEKKELSPFEIIPYEILWKWILESLDDQFHGKRKRSSSKKSV